MNNSGWTPEVTKRMRDAVAKAHPGLELYLRWDGHIAECGAGPEPTDHDVHLFSHAPSWLTDALDRIEQLEVALAEAVSIGQTLSNYVEKFPKLGGPTQTDRRLAELGALAPARKETP